MSDDPSQIPPHVSSQQASPPQAYPPGGTTPDIPSTTEERTTGLLLHLSQLLGLAMPILAIVAPLIIWQVKRDQSKYLDWHGKEVVNFQITMLIAWCAIGVLTFVTCGLAGLLLLPLVGALIVASIVCVIIAAVRANAGTCWRYPFTLRLVT